MHKTYIFFYYQIKVNRTKKLMSHAVSFVIEIP